MFRKMPKAAEVAECAEAPGIAPEALDEPEASDAQAPRRPSVRPFYVGGPEVPGAAGARSSSKDAPRTREGGRNGKRQEALENATENAGKRRREVGEREGKGRPRPSPGPELRPAMSLRVRP